jgi:hypothetical protein
LRVRGPTMNLESSCRWRELGARHEENSSRFGSAAPQSGPQAQSRPIKSRPDAPTDGDGFASRAGGAPGPAFPSGGVDMTGMRRMRRGNDIVDIIDIVRYSIVYILIHDFICITIRRVESSSKHFSHNILCRTGAITTGPSHKSIFVDGSIRGLIWHSRSRH